MVLFQTHFEVRFNLLEKKKRESLSPLLVLLVEALAFARLGERATLQRPHAYMYQSVTVFAHRTPGDIIHTYSGIYRCCNPDLTKEICEISTSQERAQRYTLFKKYVDKTLSNLIGIYRILFSTTDYSVNLSDICSAKLDILF